MLRILAIALVSSSAVFSQDRPPNSSPDPAFSTIPFDTWLTGSDQSHFQWTTRVFGGRLTSSQRLEARVDIEVDGNELVRRKGRGELAFFVQFSDRDHRVFQAHGAIDLKKVTDEAAKSNFVYTQTALVVPGEYRIDVAILDSNTGEHATLQRALHVSPLHNDPLPDSMRGLPLVEFTLAEEPPDVWFQPQLKGKLHLPLETQRPVRVEVLMNLSPTPVAPRFRTGPAGSRIVADLLPALKVLSQMELNQGDLNVTLLDLARRRILFTQDHVDPRRQPLDWITLRPAFLEADPNKISVRELADSRQSPQFFLEEVQRRISADGALIIIGGPVAFASSDDRHPVVVAGRNPGKVFYIRYHAAPARTIVPEPLPFRGGRRAGLPRSSIIEPEPPDALDALLKPLRPRIFEVYNPEQFRKALADLMKEIARM